MFEVVDEEVERCHQSQEDVAESNKRSRYMLDETNQGQLYKLERREHYDEGRNVTSTFSRGFTSSIN